jgi:hypothetical protein
LKWELVIIAQTLNENMQRAKGLWEKQMEETWEKAEAETL